MHSQRRPLRIGLYAGAFDPVHSGHISFALQAIKTARLDQVIFLPERRPRYKPGVEHFAHRSAMLKTAIRPHRRMAVAELVDKQFTVRRTLQHLRHQLPEEAQLVLMLGSDAAIQLPSWPHAAELLNECELLVAVRYNQSSQTVTDIIKAWPVQPKALTVLPAHAPHVSSTAVRAALRAGHYTRGLLSSVSRYARQQWLYISFDKSA